MNNIILQDLNEIISNPIIDWNRFNDKTVLITGANGMLPSYMAYTLLQLSNKYNIDVRVIAQVRDKTKGEAIFKDYLECANFQLLVQDVILPYNFQNSIDFVVHAASQASPKYYAIDPVGTLMANVEGTINVLKLVQNKGCESVLFFSSAEVYGKLEKEDISETDYGYLDPTAIRSCYAESKRMGEQLCNAWNAQYGTHCKSVRPFHTFGPNMKLDDGRVFADFVRNIMNNENIILKSTGEAKRAFCYVTDATVAFFKILLDGEDGCSYNMGNPMQEISIKELASKLIKMYPEKELKLIFDINEDDKVQKSAVKSVLPNVNKLKQLGWLPSVPIEFGFRRVIESKMNIL